MRVPLVPIQAGQYVLAADNDLDFPTCLWGLWTGWCHAGSAAEALRIRHIVRAMPKTYTALTDDGERLRSYDRSGIVAATWTAGELDALIAKLDRIAQRHNDRAFPVINRLASRATADIRAALPQWPAS